MSASKMRRLQWWVSSLKVASGVDADKLMKQVRKRNEIEQLYLHEKGTTSQVWKNLNNNK